MYLALLLTSSVHWSLIRNGLSGRVAVASGLMEFLVHIIVKVHRGCQEVHQCIQPFVKQREGSVMGVAAFQPIVLEILSKLMEF